MIGYRISSGGGKDYSDVHASYTVSIAGVLKETSCSYYFWRNDPGKDVFIGDEISNCFGMFSQCYNFNNNVYIGNNAKNCAQMFQSCYDFNKPINIPQNVNDTTSMFYACTKFNQNVAIPDTPDIQCTHMFESCLQLNQPIAIPNNAISTAFMFSSCRNLAQDFIIPKNVKSVGNMFINCENYHGNIYINNVGLNAAGYHNMLKNTGFNRKNVYCNNLTNLMSTGTDSIIGNYISWTAMTNGYYNAFYNIYLFNNYNGT